MNEVDNQSSEEIAISGPPYIELENIIIPEWEERTQVLQSMYDALQRGELFEKKVPSSAQKVHALRLEVEERIMEILIIPDEKKFALKWILEEVHVNSGVSHGNNGDASKILHVIYGINTEIDSVMLYVADEGPGFNPREIPDPTASIERLMKDSGRGIHTMDKLEIPKFVGAKAMYLPQEKGSDLSREFMLTIPMNQEG